MRIIIFMFLMILIIFVPPKLNSTEMVLSRNVAIAVWNGMFPLSKRTLQFQVDPFIQMVPYNEKNTFNVFLKKIKEYDAEKIKMLTHIDTILNPKKTTRAGAVTNFWDGAQYITLETWTELDTSKCHKAVIFLRDLADALENGIYHREYQLIIYPYDAGWSLPGNHLIMRDSLLFLPKPKFNKQGGINNSIDSISTNICFDSVIGNSNAIIIKDKTGINWIEFENKVDSILKTIDEKF